MASPLVGIAGVNSLLLASYAISKRAISPFPQLSLKEIAAAGAMAGAAQAILASPGVQSHAACSPNVVLTIVVSGNVQSADAGTVRIPWR